MAYIRSEEFCKQLVEVTQQWAIECDKKVRFIHALEKETSDLKTFDLKTHLQQLDARLSKNKKFWMENKDLPRGRVSDYQFDELRSELAFRRELYDQVGTVWSGLLVPIKYKYPGQCFPISLGITRWPHPLFSLYS